MIFYLKILSSCMLDSYYMNDEVFRDNVSDI